MARVTAGSRGDPIELLSLSEVLGQLDRPQLQELVRAGRTRIVEAGDELFAAGDRTEAIQVLLVGRVRLWRLTDDGHVLVLRICPPGEILGQMSALEAEGRHSVNATALEDCELLAIPAGAFTRLLEQRADLGLRLARVLAGRVRSLSDELEAMKFASIGQRLVALLRRRAAGLRELRVTHQELAEEVGATRENVSRLLGLLRDRGLLQLGRGRIEVLDHEGLQSIEL